MFRPARELLRNIYYDTFTLPICCEFMDKAKRGGAAIPACDLPRATLRRAEPPSWLVGSQGRDQCRSGPHVRATARAAVGGLGILAPAADLKVLVDMRLAPGVVGRESAAEDRNGKQGRAGQASS